MANLNPLGPPVRATITGLSAAASVEINDAVYKLQRRGMDITTLSLGEAFFKQPMLPISDHELKSAVITAAMAPGVNAFLFSNIYKRSIEIAASSVILCTSLSVISSAFWISLIH